LHDWFTSRINEITCSKMQHLRWHWSYCITLIYEWLVRQVDDANDNEGERNDLVFDEDPTLNWAIVYEVSRVGEPVVYTRRKTSNKRKQP